MLPDGIACHEFKRVLIVRLRSIGDTVLSTPTLIALKRSVPHVKVDILLEDWVAPLLDGFEHVDEVIAVGKGTRERLRAAMLLRGRRYDVVFNLHGGTTAAFFTAASMASHRYGIADYQYSFLHNHVLSSAAKFWSRELTHSAEQQLAVIGSSGIAVNDRPRTHLAVTKKALAEADRIASKLSQERFALIHPASAFETKRWPIEKFARTIEFLQTQGLSAIAVGDEADADILNELTHISKVPISIHIDLNLPEITALASRASLFVGNDSGVAHIAAAVKTPTVVIFGSSNRVHWRPWTDAPNEIVFNEFHCQPCAGYICAEFGAPRCILSVTDESVFRAISRIMEKSAS
jgi:lipopolysaccharide heptosyltransferase II